MNLFRLLFPEPPPKPVKTKKVKKKKTKVVNVAVHAKGDGDDAQKAGEDTKDVIVPPNQHTNNDSAPTDEELSQPQLVNLDNMDHRIVPSSPKKSSLITVDILKTVQELNKQIESKGEVMSNLESTITTLQQRELLSQSKEALKVELAELKAACEKYEIENKELKEQINILQQNQWLLNNQYQNLQTSSTATIQKLNDQINSNRQQYETTTNHLIKEVENVTRANKAHEEKQTSMAYQIQSLQAEKARIEAELINIRRLPS